MTRVTVKHLGLAAYMKMQGATLVSVANRQFIFDTTQTVAEWRVAYNNSCCMRHDSLVCEMRHFLKD